MRHLARAAVLLSFVLILVGRAQAGESIWGMEGLGRPVEGYDLAARGAGSAAIAIDDPYGMSFINPAGIAHARLPQAHFGLDLQDRWISAQGTDGSDRRFDARITAARLVLPGPGALRWSLGYRNLTDATYRVKVRVNEGRDDEFQRTLRGRGGVGELSLGLAAGLADNRLAVGGQLGIINGMLHDVAEDRYAGGAYLDGNNTLRTRVENGTVVGLGIQARILPRLSAGACWRASGEIGLRGLWSTTEETTWEERASFDLPSSFGLGLSWRAGSRLRLAADWSHAAWGDSGFRLKGTREAEPSAAGFGTLQDTDRLGVGLTFFPPVFEQKVSARRRIAWRAGFTWGELPVRQSDGATVTEWAVTGGLGVPVQTDRGYMDVLLEVGRTGDAAAIGIQERFVRVGIGLTFGRLESKF